LLSDTLLFCHITGKLVLFLCLFLGHANPFATILTGLKIGEEDLKYYDLTKLEDIRYGISILLQFVSECL